MYEHLEIEPEGNEYLLDTDWHFQTLSYDDCTKIFTLPDSVLKVGDSAFSSTDAQVIIIPASCESVSENAFADCPELLFVVNHAAGLEITVPSGVTLINDPQ